MNVRQKTSVTIMFFFLLPNNKKCLLKLQCRTCIMDSFTIKFKCNLLNFFCFLYNCLNSIYLMSCASLCNCLAWVSCLASPHPMFLFSTVLYVCFFQSFRGLPIFLSFIIPYKFFSNLPNYKYSVLCISPRSKTLLSLF